MTKPAGSPSGLAPLRSNRREALKIGCVATLCQYFCYPVFNVFVYENKTYNVLIVAHDLHDLSPQDKIDSQYETNVISWELIL